MPAKSGDYLRQYSLLSATAEVTVGSETALYTAVNLAGAASVNARGVVVNSRDGFVTICTLGTAPVRVADGVSIVKGAPVGVNSSGFVIPQAAASDSIGISLDSVTTAAGDYIEIFVNPQPYVAAT
jgi:hypothetical protein